MRFLRKTAYLSPSKFGRIFIAVLLSTMCVMGLKSFLSIEEISTKKAMPRNISDQPSELQLNDDAPDSPLTMPNVEDKPAFQPAGNGQMDKMNNADPSESQYPGWREGGEERQRATPSAAQPSISEDENEIHTGKKRVKGTLPSQEQLTRPFPGADIVKGPPPPMNSFDAFNMFGTQTTPPAPVPLATGQQLLHGDAVSPPTVAPHLQRVPVPNNLNPAWPQKNQPGVPMTVRAPMEPQNNVLFRGPPNSPQGFVTVNAPFPQFAANNMPALPNPEQIQGVYQAPSNQAVPQNPHVTINERVVHFDLKGAPFKLSYYKEVFPMLRKLGATGLLMEYEDMFPYSGRFKMVNAGNAYKKSEIMEINRLAHENGLYVIPLVQTFGHLEFVLKHKEFKEFREVEEYVSAVCPSRNGTLELVMEMVEQMLHLHPNATYLHIGADEVFHLGQCPVCHQAIQNNYFIGRQNLFLSHVAHVLHVLRTKYPHIRPIMWDDMFHNMHVDTIKNGLGDYVNYVEIMIWSYFTEWTRHLPRNGDLYGPIFPNIWGATAFKGSDGETRQMPNVKTQLEIHTSWLEALRQNGHKMQNFRGIVLTGWQRYDHFYPLCELFPLAIPSLAINLQVLQIGDYNATVIDHVSKVLGCEAIRPTNDFFTYDPTAAQFNTCQFPGVEVFRVVHLVEDIRKPVKDFLEELTGRYPEYQMRQQYMQLWRTDEQIQKINGYLFLYVGYLNRSKEAFLEVFDESTHSEWTAGNVDPFIKQLTAWRGIFETVASKEEWPSRPLNIPTLPPPELPTTDAPPPNPWLRGWSPPDPLVPFGNDQNMPPLPPPEQPHLQGQPGGPLQVPRGDQRLTQRQMVESFQNQQNMPGPIPGRLGGPVRQMPSAGNQPMFQPHWFNGRNNQPAVAQNEPQNIPMYFGK